MIKHPKNPRAALEKERSILANIDAQLASLVGQRTEILLGEDALPAIEKIDAELARFQRARGVHNERIDLLTAETARLDLEDRAAARRKAIDEQLVPAVAELTVLASELQDALLGAYAAYQKLTRRRDEINQAAPDVPRSDSLWFTHLDMNVLRVYPGQSGESLLRQLSLNAKDVCSGVQRAGESFIRACRGTPLPGAADDRAREAA
jgi:hypothetical protein